MHGAGVERVGVGGYDGRRARGTVMSAAVAVTLALRHERLRLRHEPLPAARAAEIPDAAGVLDARCGA
jgi:hypothetical protein